jgi:hypothetical protein
MGWERDRRHFVSSPQHSRNEEGTARHTRFSGLSLDIHLKHTAEVKTEAAKEKRGEGGRGERCIQVGRAGPCESTCA